MRIFLRTIIFGTVLVALGVVNLGAQAVDPVVGTWELNIAKSKFRRIPAHKSETRTYVVAGNEIKATSGQWTINYDGKDRPATGLSDADALSLKRINANTAEFTQKKAGKVVGT